MKKSVWLCGAVLVLAAVGPASAAMKPGLWDYSTKMTMPGMPAMPDLSQLPPAARAAIEARGIPGMGQPMRTQVCVTPAQAARSTPPAGRAGCTNQNVKMTGNTVSGDVVCNTPDMMMTGHFDATFVSDGEMHTVMNMKGTQGGRPMEMNMDTTGTFVATDCGSVKPMAD